VGLKTGAWFALSEGVLKFEASADATAGCAQKMILFDLG
jgi:hypothetical protein